MKTRTLVLVATLVTLLAAVGAIIVVQRRPDSTPLLGNVGATLARVPITQGRAEFDKVSIDSGAKGTILAPGLDLGEVLRKDGDGPWFKQVIDPERADTPYVADTVVCGDSETVLVASGNVGTELDGGVFLEESNIAVPTIWRSAANKPWTRVSVDAAPTPSSLRAIASARNIGRPNRLIAIGEQLAAGRTPYVAVSDDCGVTWKVEDLSGGRARTVADELLVDDQGVLIVGRTDATKPDERSVIVWSGTDRDNPLSLDPTILETGATLRGEIALLRRSDQSITIGLMNRDLRSASFLLWDGTSTGTTRFGERVDDWYPIGFANGTAGPYLLSLADGGRKLQVRRFTIDGARMDTLPRINGQQFRQVRFIDDGGPTMWVIGEREDFQLRAWSITLLSTASCAEQVDGGDC
jgi:hypothetical protein